MGSKDPEPPPGYKRALGTSKDITMAQVDVEDNVKATKRKTLSQIVVDNQHENVAVIIPDKSIDKKSKECRTRVDVLPVLGHSEDSKLDKVEERDFVPENLTNNLENAGVDKITNLQELSANILAIAENMKSLDDNSRSSLEEIAEKIAGAEESSKLALELISTTMDARGKDSELALRDVGHNALNGLKSFETELKASGSNLA